MTFTPESIGTITVSAFATTLVVGDGGSGVVPAAVWQQLHG